MFKPLFRSAYTFLEMRWKQVLKERVREPTRSLLLNILLRSTRNCVWGH